MGITRGMAPVVPGGGVAGSPLLDAARRALQEAPGRVALRVAAGRGAGLAPHRRRVLKVLLQDAAQSGGGQVFETAEGELLLLGAASASAARAAQSVNQLGGEATPLAETWLLPRDGESLLRWAGAARLPTVPPGRAAPGDLAGLDSLLGAMPPERVLRRRALLTMRRGAPPALAGRMLEMSPAMLHAELGPLAGDADLVAHAAEHLAGQLPAMLAQGLAHGMAAGDGPLLLPLPRACHPGPAPRPGLVAVLPLAEAADPRRLATRRAALARDGWQLALAGLDLSALRLLAAAALPAAMLLLRWSPALASQDGNLMSGLAPGGLVLTGCDSPEAVAWGSTQGITCFAGAHVEALLAATRMASCPAAAECGQRQCGERSAATAAVGRGGCRNPALLAAMLPAMPSA